MLNEVFKLGQITIHGYGLMIAIGLICAFALGGERAKKRGLDANIVYSLGFIAVIFGFIGAKLLYCFVELDEMVRNPWNTLSGSGFVVYGGIIFGVCAGYVYCRLKGIKFWVYLDLLAPSIAVAQGFGRIGCFLAGCCYGAETNLPIGVVFHNSTIAPNGVPLLPTQLISSVGDFLIAFILLQYSAKTRTSGKIGSLYLILYGFGRFAIEFFRADSRGSIGILSTSQFISALILVAGLGLFFADKFYTSNGMRSNV